MQHAAHRHCVLRAACSITPHSPSFHSSVPGITPPHPHLTHITIGHYGTTVRSELPHHHTIANGRMDGRTASPPPPPPPPRREILRIIVHTSPILATPGRHALSIPDAALGATATTQAQTQRTGYTTLHTSPVCRDAIYDRANDTTR
ncbi:hypothetical protein CKAH01_00755 [Colletotrichum kahawae]|uniref:Uncharacterized protein n=1 Tax=Colletotrichum kahawae TaxID=34407 RepID=A0AAE0D8D4_COLKA|nr:hypothetical protein CKAH01_00755 [Colletotrichum kahawae]